MFGRLAQAFTGEAQLNYLEGAVLVAGSGVVFSFTALLFRATNDATDWQFMALRGISMAVVLAAVAALRRNTSRPVRFDVIDAKIALASALLASMSMLYVLALARTTAALAVIFLALGPFSGALWGWLVLRERVSRVTWAAMTVALLGVAVMVGGGLEAGAVSGVLMAACIPVILGLYNVLIRSADHRVDPIVPGILGGAMLGIGGGIVAAFDTGLRVSGHDLIFGVLSGAVILGIGLPLFNLGHRSVPTAQVSLLSMLEIILSPLWVWIWPGETPSRGTLLGGTIVMGAVIWLVMASQNRGAIVARTAGVHRERQNLSPFDRGKKPGRH